MVKSKGEIIAGIAIIFCLFLYPTIAQWTSMPHIMTVAQTMDTSHPEYEGSPEDEDNLLGTVDVVQQVDSMINLHHDLHLTDWKVVWRGSTDTETVTQLEQALQATDSSFTLDKEEQLTHQEHPEQITELKSWEKEVNGTTHKINLINDPQKSHHQTKIIYTWSSSDRVTVMDQAWAEEYVELEQWFQSFIQEPEQFITWHAQSTNAFFRQAIEQNIFGQWMTEWQGYEKQIVTDENFLSQTGYIPTWENRVQMTDDSQFNIQMSARQNTLEDQTFVTIGYPLILQEH
ncbi:YwmB family TATA-box binding protein [Caldalkalibacillus salinus]|uniref:YwmB family TATA-box binding protein n=1 Tax=Caldalkalibacillus salinus TaxID=2803787 RepID=UPI001922D4D8|nr:YwmB family TATA-box binding protein [Caldalkalibacillus salinus]